jgi:hypothetical protein
VRVFRPQIAETDRISFATGDWKAVLTNPLPPSPSPDKGHEDPGISQAAQNLLALLPMKRKCRPSSSNRLGSLWPRVVEGWRGCVSETFEIPARFAGQDLQLSLGSVDDNETTYLDGQPLGATNGWNERRLYIIPAAKASAGKHVLAVRVWDRFGGGGFTSAAEDVYLKPVQSSVPATLYHADYRADFEFGDDPYRYYRW